MLRQVLANLVENAVKYSPAGGRVHVSLGRHEGRVLFAVRDEGLGIPLREQERIFEKFFRLDPNLTRGVGGTGLGLYICRELVRRMGGRIWVASREGEGSTFFFELPVGGRRRAPGGGPGHGPEARAAQSLEAEEGADAVGGVEVVAVAHGPDRAAVGERLVDGEVEAVLRQSSSCVPSSGHLRPSTESRPQAGQRLTARVAPSRKSRRSTRASDAASSVAAQPDEARPFRPSSSLPAVDHLGLPLVPPALEHGRGDREELRAAGVRLGLGDAGDARAGLLREEAVELGPGLLDARRRPPAASEAGGRSGRARPPPA